MITHYAKLTPLNNSTIRHALDVAARTFKENAEGMRALAAAPADGGMITRDAARRLAGEFDRYERDTLAVLEVLDFTRGEVVFAELPE